MPYKDIEKRRQYAREANRRWRKRHPDKVRALKRKYYRHGKGAEQSRKWRALNAERVREKNRQWCMANKDKRKAAAARYKDRKGTILLSARRKQWRKLHPERDRAALARWRAKNKEKLRLLRIAKNEKLKSRPKEWAKARLRLTHNLCTHRARQHGSVGAHTLRQWLARVEFYGWRCVYCGELLFVGTLTKDHRIPLTKGGTEWASNLVPACQPCNSSKGNRKIPKLLNHQPSRPPKRFLRREE